MFIESDIKEISYDFYYPIQHNFFYISVFGAEESRVHLPLGSVDTCMPMLSLSPILCCCILLSFDNSHTNTVQKIPITIVYITHKKLLCLCVAACVCLFDYVRGEKGVCYVDHWVSGEKWCQKGKSVFMARQISSSWQVYSHYVAVRSRRRVIFELRVRVPMHQRKPISLLVSPSKANLHLQTPAGQNKVSYLWSSQQHADATETDSGCDSLSAYPTPEPTTAWCFDHCHSAIKRHGNC